MPYCAYSDVADELGEEILLAALPREVREDPDPAVAVAFVDAKCASESSRVDSALRQAGYPLPILWEQHIADPGLRAELQERLRKATAVFVAYSLSPATEDVTKGLEKAFAREEKWLGEVAAKRRQLPGLPAEPAFVTARRDRGPAITGDLFRRFHGRRS